MERKEPQVHKVLLALREQRERLDQLALLDFRELKELLVFKAQSERREAPGTERS
jgi:hypothetical protein